jgi:hypothetical protein
MSFGTALDLFCSAFSLLLVATSILLPLFLGYWLVELNDKLKDPREMDFRHFFGVIY